MPLRRLHLFEFEDLTWWPRLLRDYHTDALDAMSVRLGSAGRIAEIFRIALARTGARRIVDFGSGGGGGLVAVRRALDAEYPDLHITATDLYPNAGAGARLREASGGQVEYREESVDATRAPADLAGLRTLSRIFHHLPPDAAQAVVRDAVGRRAPLLVLEFQERTLKDVGAMILGSPLYTFLVTPGIRPFRLSRLLLTYLVPVIPFLVTWDGVVSALRTYTLDELRAMTQAVEGGEDYDWEFVRIPGRPMATTYALGAPRES